MLARRWPLILILPLVAGVAVYVTQAGEQSRYASTSQVLVQSTDLGAVLAGVPDLSAPDPGRVVATEKEIAAVPEVLERAKASLPESPAAGSAAMRVSSSQSFSAGDSDVIDLTVTADDPAYARELATAVAGEYVRFRAEIATEQLRQARDELARRTEALESAGRADTRQYESLLTQLDQLNTLLIVGNGRARLLTGGDQADKVAPTPVQKGIVGGALGLLVALAMAFAAERLDRSVRTADEVAEMLDAPVLGRLSDPRRLGGRHPVVALHEPQSAEGEAFRALRAALRFALAAHGGKVIGITSASQGEGKSFTASNLGVVAAAAGADVLLVDLDLRRPVLHTSFDQARAPGLSDVVAGGAGWRDAARAIDVAHPGGATTLPGSLTLLTAGTQVPNPSEFVDSEAVRHLIDGASGSADLAILDMPPALAVNDTVSLASVLAGVLVVVRDGAARRGDLQELRETLGAAGIPILGIVITAAWRRSKRYGYGYDDADRSGSGGRAGGGDRSRDGAVESASRVRFPS